MPNVVQFPLHARASSGVLAERATRCSAVTPAPRTRGQAKIDAHHSGGIAPRSAHFEIIQPEALSPETSEISSAMASRVGQSSMIERNEVMPSSLGQSVLNCKAKMSHDGFSAVAHNSAMDRMTETEEKAAFIQRVKIARQSRFDSQKPMLTILGIPQGTYKQYETRTPLPHRYIPKFCAATGVSMEWLLTGEGKGPEAAVAAPAPKKRTKSHPRAKAA